MQMLTFQNPSKIPVVELIKSRCFFVTHLFLSIRPIYQMRSFKGPQYTDEVDILFDVVLEKLELLVLDILLMPYLLGTLL